MIRLGAKSQAEIAELFNVDRSTITRMMKEVRMKERRRPGCGERIDPEAKKLTYSWWNQDLPTEPPPVT